MVCVVLAVSPGRLGFCPAPAGPLGCRSPPATFAGATPVLERCSVGSVIKKRRKRMAKKKHRKLLKKTRVQRRKLGK